MKGVERMAYYRTCPLCGSNNDPGEACDCRAETKKEWIDTELFRLIDYRYSNKRVTIFTSNIPMDSLKLNERIVDRIFSMCIKLDLSLIHI